jgi:hypothetical protein
MSFMNERWEYSPFEARENCGWTPLIERLDRHVWNAAWA